MLLTAHLRNLWLLSICFNAGFLSISFLHLFPVRNFGDNCYRLFMGRMDAVSVSQPPVSQFWRQRKALTPTRENLIVSWFTAWLLSDGAFHFLYRLSDACTKYRGYDWSIQMCHILFCECELIFGALQCCHFIGIIYQSIMWLNNWLFYRSMQNWRWTLTVATRLVNPPACQGCSLHCSSNIHVCLIIFCNQELGIIAGLDK